MAGTLLRRAATILGAALGVLALGAGSAFGSGGAPFDGTQGLAKTNAGSPLATSPFALGVDLSSLGVSPADFLSVGLAGATATSAGSGPHMYIVDDNMLDCPNAQFTSIKAAVMAAGPGDSVKVCPGTYIEQVVIGPGKDGLQVFSEVPQAAIIKAPVVMAPPSAIVLVDGSTDVTIRHFTVTGPYFVSGCTVQRHTGVRVASGSATIYGNHITQIRAADPTLFGCQDGVGVLVGRALELQAGTATVRQNLVDEYQKGGIVVDGQGSFADVRQNEVVGSGATPITAQNGIQVSRDAHATVDHNRVRGNVFGVPVSDTDAADASGIILYNLSGGVQASYNDVYGNEDGVLIDAIPGDFHVGSTTGVEISHNNSHDNALYGVVAGTDTSENPIAYNRLFGNGLFDCADYSAGPYNSPANVANPWTNDQGSSENRPGLCRKATP
ncbi:MAG: hypothetical protein QOF27_2830 [Gaiellaceae bacterium]|nr:hypothetical protein [Gaiellaceae bacterium]